MVIAHKTIKSTLTKKKKQPDFKSLVPYSFVIKVYKEM